MSSSFPIESCRDVVYNAPWRLLLACLLLLPWVAAGAAPAGQQVGPFALGAPGPGGSKGGKQLQALLQVGGPAAKRN